MTGRSRFEVVAIAVLVVVLIAFAISLGRRMLSEPSEPVRVDTAQAVVTPEPPAGPRIRVEVLNASGKAGLARRATESLRSQGFDVVYFGTARRDAVAGGRSVVLDRVGNLRNAQQIARALNIQRVESKPDPGLVLDVTVLLGGDWPGAN